MLLVCAAILFSLRAVSCDGDVVATHSTPIHQALPFSWSGTTGRHRRQTGARSATGGPPALAPAHAPRRLLPEAQRARRRRRPRARTRSTPGSLPARTARGQIGVDLVLWVTVLMLLMIAMKCLRKVEKLRKFLDKYKVAVSKFMSNRVETPSTASLRQLRDSSGSEEGLDHRPPSGAHAGLEDSALDAEALSARLDHRPPRVAREGLLELALDVEALPRVHEHRPPGDVQEGLEELASDAAAHAQPAGLDYLPPSSAQLDMSPARGGLVYSLRSKNRLCHRHVMVPEGPKYDSKGRQYLAEHARARGEYAHTRAPRLLLPKCCNCCRKSVLGCE